MQLMGAARWKQQQQQRRHLSLQRGQAGTSRGMCLGAAGAATGTADEYLNKVSCFPLFCQMHLDEGLLKDGSTGCGDVLHVQLPGVELHMTHISLEAVAFGLGHWGFLGLLVAFWCIVAFLGVSGLPGAAWGWLGLLAASWCIVASLGVSGCLWPSRGCWGLLGASLGWGIVVPRRLSLLKLGRCGFLGLLGALGLLVASCGCLGLLLCFSGLLGASWGWCILQQRLLSLLVFIGFQQWGHRGHSWHDSIAAGVAMLAALLLDVFAMHRRQWA